MAQAPLTKDFNTSLLLNALHSMGFSLSALEQTPLIHIKRGRKQEYLYDLASSAESFPAGWIASDKYYSKQFLAYFGVPVPKGKAFLSSQREQAVSFAKKLGFPVVLKPTSQGHGDNVYVGIRDEKKLLEKLNQFADEHIGNGYVLIEEYVPGNEYRLFCTKSGFFAAVHRIPASISGDGKQKIITLIQEENYRRMNPRVNCLCEIRLDDILFEYLSEQGISMNDVPKKGECVQLRPSSNVTKGGNCIDVTSEIHPSFRRFAKKVLSSVPGLPFVGIDVICASHTKDLAKQRYVVCELNQSPGLSLHELPAVGQKRHSSRAVAREIGARYA